MDQSYAVVDHLAALSDGLRVRMIALLEGRELTVSELCDILQLPQSTVSRHLKTLSDGAWVSSRRDGTHRLYTLPLGDLDSSARRLWDVVREQVATSPAAADDNRRLKQVLARRRTKSEAFFSSAAGQWNRLREDLFGATSHLRAMVGLLDPAAVVGDLGCGTGNISEWVAPFAARVIAVDASKQMLKSAREHLADHRHVELRQGSLEKLPIVDGELDVALMMLVLHHLPEPQRALAEAARALRPDGRILILDMMSHEREDYRQTMGHVWLGFSEKQMSQWLPAAGFRDVRWCPLPPEPGAKGPSLFVASARRT
jgi:2-polyprenyl-3-methyl-5-hydroxy-6-metoxy-1,4-benzoquinol methylase